MDYFQLIATNQATGLDLIEDAVVFENTGQVGVGMTSCVGLAEHIFATNKNSSEACEWHVNYYRGMEFLQRVL